MVARVGVALLLLLITPNVLTAERVTRFIPSSVISFLPRLQLPLPLSALSSFFPSFSPWRSGTRTYSLSTSFRNDVAFIFSAAARGLRVRKFRAKNHRRERGMEILNRHPAGRFLLGRRTVSFLVSLVPPPGKQPQGRRLDGFRRLTFHIRLAMTLSLVRGMAQCR